MISYDAYIWLFLVLVAGYEICRKWLLPKEITKEKLLRSYMFIILFLYLIAVILNNTLSEPYEAFFKRILGINP